MLTAFSLARRGLGNTWPNPAVGCVIVKGGVVVGRGWTQPGGRPHAEAEALARAGDRARGATAYVTLEPCAHHGQTPPCAEALIAAGIERVVSALEDPDPRVAGKGHAMLRAAGVAVEVGPGAAAARAVNRGFLTRLAQGRPMVTLKLATSLDGRIATRTGDSKWITGPAARERAHLLRATHDATMVGIGTALADDPELTCRLPGLASSRQVRVVMDSQVRLPLAGALASSARAQPVWLVAGADADPARIAALTAAGVEVLRVPAAPDGRAAAGAALLALGERGLTRLLVEGGGRLAASLLLAGLVDRLVWFRAPVVIGADGVPAVAGLDVASLAQSLGFARVSVEAVGADLMETYDVASAARAG
ncbi:MAG: bifunctional diaminohydroxyphosphoribosylaminopyrimidine deaminase/5-amino-6-(5-phosphoribosylamino)uracil reductase RibD [Alphaproteobacteria bacterium]|nr:bifunctional diaminohydroxyphosphoribosylaminopyrimidine deaminase/5-amino-6-(5-phosphoribosylamino)uracil reductase RibD [Alphaproteobacteria bacterium]